MSEILTYTAQDVSQLVVGTVAADAVIRGQSGAADIQVTCRRHGPDTPSFLREGDTVRLVGAFAERIVVPDTLHIAAEASQGDLRVQNLVGEVNLQDVRGDLRLEQLSGLVLLQHAAADIRADDVAELHIDGICSGDVRFSGGNLAAETLAGDVRIADAAALRLNRVHGDLWLEGASGEVEITQISGDARIADVAGAVTLGTVFGDLRVTGLTGGLNATQINGDAILEGPFAGPAEYHVTANGDIHLALPATADVRLAVRALGRIRSDVPLTPTADGTPAFSATIGQGEGYIQLTGRGDLRITQVGASGQGWQGQGAGAGGGDPFADLHNLGDRIRQQVSASLAAAGINIEAGEINWGRGERGRGFRGPRPVPPVPPVPPAPPERPRSPERAKSSEPVGATSAEQLAILQMVQEGQITAEEADRLLRALGN